jgi:hypothetical protein
MTLNLPSRGGSQGHLASGGQLRQGMGSRMEVRGRMSGAVQWQNWSQQRSVAEGIGSLKMSLGVPEGTRKTPSPRRRPSQL